MAQKYRIYINEKVILLTESIPSGNYEPIAAEGFKFEMAYARVLTQKKSHFYVLCKDAKAFLKGVLKNTMLIKAAGGLVKNEYDQYLFIFRNNKWDLPKGKVEKGEKVKDAAVREVEEECGIIVSSREEKICRTYHSYINKGELVLKKTYWFAMKCKGMDKLVPQVEEGITEVRWFKKEEIGTILTNTFPSITDVLVKERLVKDKAAPL